MQMRSTSMLVAAFVLLVQLQVHARPAPGQGTTAPRRNAAFKAKLSGQTWQTRSSWRPRSSTGPSAGPRLKIHSIGQVVIMRTEVPATKNGVAGIERRDHVRLRAAGSTSPNQVTSHQAYGKTLSLTSERFALRKVDRGQLHQAAVKGVLSSGATNSRDAYRAAMTGLTSSLGDKYSAYQAPKVWKQKVQRRAGTSSGIGIKMSSTAGNVAISGITPGSPAEGTLKAGDRLIKMDRVPIRSTDDVQRALKGKVGKQVAVTVNRAGREQRLSLIPKKYKERLVDAELKDGVGVVKLSRFAAGAADEVRVALGGLKQRNGGALRGVVLDLRGNGGGLTAEAHGLLNLFIPRGELFSFTRHGASLDKHSADPNKAFLTKTPLAVLVDKNSASSSEIVAGALKHRGRARLIGQTTFGKGIAQHNFKLPDGGGLKLTSMDITLASSSGKGVRYHGRGLQPDISAPAGDALKTALGMLRR